MKILAIIELVPSAERASVAAHLTQELKAAWRLYTDDVIRECHATDRPGRVVFLLEAADIDAARDALETLPMIPLGLFNIEIMELRPFSNWDRLFAN